MRSCTRRPIARILLAALLAAPAARAEIAGEQVVSGTATFEQSGPVTTIHASDGAIINYSQFDVWANEELHFVQPSSDARVLNRVFGDATHIDGGLYANGIVYIVNPAGIFFGPFSVVDVGGLYAAAGDISNEDFLARIDRFTLSGTVANAGSIESPAVALLGTAVANHGNIRAPEGTIALVAGEKVLLTQLGAHIAVAVEGAGGSAQAPAIEQTGTADSGAGAISFVTGDVYSLAINHTGITRGRDIELRAQGGTVQVSGTLDASDRSAGGTGGSIVVTGERVALVGAQLDATGAAGGGALRVGGDLRGEGELPTARRSYVDEASALRADAIAHGDGGRVIVWADEATAFHGTVSARGGAAGGDGGFAEISGAALAADGDVDLSAASGATGTLLYDPKDIVLHAGALDGSDAPDPSDVTLSGASLGQVLFGTPDELATPFDVYESELEGTNANIVLQATNSISSPDTFAVRIIDGNSLTMQTRNNTDDQLGTALAPGIHLAGVSFQTGGAGAITIATGTDGTATGGGTGSAAGVEVGDLTTAGAAVSVSTRNGSIEVVDVTTSGAAGATGGAAGAISLLAGDSDKLGDSNVTVTGQLIARGGTGTDGAGGNGGAVRVRSDGVNNQPFPDDSEQEVVAGGGDLSLANLAGIDVDTRGGAGTTTGGRGGTVQIITTDGTISAGEIESSGGAGGTIGGPAGGITLTTRDADMLNDNNVVVGALRAAGGSGTSGAGGSGATISVQTQRSLEIVSDDDPDVVLQEQVGGGDVTIASLDSSGGNGGTNGANAGAAIAQARGEGNALSVGGVTATGGDGSNGNGGRGGNVTLLAQDSDLVIDDPIASHGGDGANAAATARGGNGGDIALTTGIEEDDTGNVQIQALLDAREGASGANAVATLLANVDGGTISITSAGDIDQTGTTALIHTTGDVTLSAENDIGQATGALLVQGANERRLGTSGARLDVLSVRAGGTADVGAVAGGRFLGELQVTATGDAANLHVTQEGGVSDDVIEMIGSAGMNRVVVNQVDTLASKADVTVAFDNLDEDTLDGALVLATGVADPVIEPGRTFAARSDGHVVVGTGAGVVIRAGTVEDPVTPTNPTTAGAVLISADEDSDGTGGIRASSGAAVIDMLGGAAESGELDLLAGEGIGDATIPITVSGGARLAALQQPLKPDPENDGQFIFDPDGPEGIYLRNQGSGDLEIVSTSQAIGVQHSAGMGEIEITNAVGGITVGSALRAKPLPNDDETSNGAGGAVMLAVAPGSQIVLDVSSFGDTPAIGSGGAQIYNGDVALAQNTEIESDGGVDINGGLDTQASAPGALSFTATLGDGTTFAVQDRVGAQRALGSFTLASVLIGADGGPLRLDLPGVTTAAGQAYRDDISLVQDTSLGAGGTVEFAGNVASPAADFTVTTSDRVLFSAAGDQSVTTAGNIAFSPAGRADIPAEASIAKPSGNLSLASSGGSVILGDREKASVAGSLAITGSTVRVTDLSALDISVTSPDAQVFARTPGPVATRGETILDGGTDIVANTVAFSSAPAVVGGGPAPRIATPSGTAQNAGALPVQQLPAPISAADIASGSRVFDLAIPAVDPGHETQEIQTTPLDPPLEPQPSQDRAGPGAPVSREEVVVFLACAPLGGEYAPTGCAPTEPPAYGSALDTERAVEVARAYRELLGDSPRATAGRTALANAALDRRADLGSATSPAGRIYLTEVARVLGQVRLLGLGERYPEVRADLLAAIAAAIGSQQIDAARLGAAVDARAMGMPI